MNGAQWQGLVLTPLDTLFFRDGRPFDAAARVLGGLPHPQTLAGALRTALLGRSGFDFRAFAERRRSEGVREALKDAPSWVVNARFRGPWLALARKGQHIDPLLPLPAVLARKHGTEGWLRSRPREQNDIPGWPADSLLPLWRKGKPDTKAGGGFITLSGLKAFLRDDEVPTAEVFRPGELYDFDHRTGIGLNMETLTSEDGQIYGLRLLSLARQVRGEETSVCLYAEVLPGEGGGDVRSFFTQPIPLGGEGRYASVEVRGPCDWPAADAGRPRSLWYLASPAFFEAGSGLPALRDGLRLRAAASGSGVAVSGWDVARNGPRPTRFAVPGGAVYFIEGQVPPEGPFRLADEDASEGWGFALQGVW